MNIRVLHRDGIDEHYKDVIKYIYADNKILIYDSMTTYNITNEDVLFIQVWEEQNKEK